MPTRALPMKKIRDLIRLKYEARLSHEQIARALAVSKGVVAKYVAQVDARGLRSDDAAEAARGRGRATARAGSAATAVRRTGGPGLRRGTPRSQAPWRDGDAALGGVPGGERRAADLPLLAVRRALPRVRRGAAPLDAPDPRRRREAVRRLRRRHGALWARRRARPDLRHRARRIQLHVRLRDATPDARRLGGCAGARARVRRWCARSDRAGQRPCAHRRSRPLRAAGFGHDLGSGEPLRHGGAAGPAISTARQGEGRGRRADRRALDPRTTAQPQLRHARRRGWRGRRSAREPEPPAVQAAARVAGEPVRRSRPSGAGAVAGRSLRARPLQCGTGQHRLPRRRRRASLQRAARARAPDRRDPRHAPHRRSPAQGATSRRPPALVRALRLHHGARTPAGRAPRPSRMVAGAADPLGRESRHGLCRGHPPHPRHPASSRAQLPCLPRPARARARATEPRGSRRPVLVRSPSAAPATTPWPTSSRTDRRPCTAARRDRLVGPRALRTCAAPSTTSDPLRRTRR